MTGPALRLIYALALVAAFSGPAMAHSLEEVEGTLQGKETYFQPVDMEAPGFALQGAEGRIVGLADFRGKVVILNFIYTHCPDICPLHTERLVEIQQMINASPMKEQVQFVTITTDPKQDTPQMLRDYGDSHGTDTVNWTLLTTKTDQAKDSTRRIAEAYGLKFTATDGMQMHGLVTHVIDMRKTRSFSVRLFEAALWVASFVVMVGFAYMIVGEFFPLAYQQQAEPCFADAPEKAKLEPC
jgi:protein SCO1/2